MTRPSAPMLTAEYHNYSDPQFNDYYGGYQPKEGTYPRTANAPRRVEVVTEKNIGCSVNPAASSKCVNVFLIIRSFCTLALYALLWSSGIRHEVIAYLAGYDAVTILTSFLMCCGISATQPFLCIPFVVLRTMEAFVCFCFCLAFGWSVIDRNSDPYRIILNLVRGLAKKFSIENVELQDLSYQICCLYLFISCTVFAAALYVCRIAWTCTMFVTDEYRRKRVRGNKDVARVMVASDELYTNY
uniref:MARVEL domain-containing protein n=1 Tax=Heterorhabditis bacteriophora TaxID=37862 RepID=A0A1I7XGR9_HETBA